MTEEQILKKEKELNEKCRRCIEKYGNPSYDHCQYHCQTGKELRRLDAEKGKGGWGSHENW